MKQYDAKRRTKDPADYSPDYRRPPVRRARTPDCHPERRHVALGLCLACYQKDRLERPRATCVHSNRPATARGLCNACYKNRQYDMDPERFRAQVRASGAAIRERDRREMIVAYGGRCACSNCPETNAAFLCLDHVNGDGKAHRLKVGSHTYSDLRRRGWPEEGFRLLCWNCNASTRFGRTCPHEET